MRQSSYIYGGGGGGGGEGGEPSRERDSRQSGSGPDQQRWPRGESLPSPGKRKRNTASEPGVLWQTPPVLRADQAQYFERMLNMRSLVLIVVLTC